MFYKAANHYYKCIHKKIRQNIAFYLLKLLSKYSVVNQFFRVNQYAFYKPSNIKGSLALYYAKTCQFRHFGLGKYESIIAFRTSSCQIFNYFIIYLLLFHILYHCLYTIGYLFNTIFLEHITQVNQKSLKKPEILFYYC